MPISGPMIELAIQLSRSHELCLGDPDFLSKVGWTSNDVGDFLATKTSLHDPAPDPAHATMYAEVSRTNFQVKPTGNFRLNNPHFNDSIDKCKLKCQLKPITHPAQLAFSDFGRSRQNLQAVHRLNYSGGSMPKLSTPIKNGEICVTHSLFEKIQDQAPPPTDEQDHDEAPEIETPVDEDHADGQPAHDANEEAEVENGINAADDTTAPPTALAQVDNGADTADDTPPTPTVPDQVDNATDAAHDAPAPVDNGIDIADDMPGPPTALEAPSPWTMEGWPVEGRWREEMLGLRGKYNLCPLIVYDGLEEDAQPLLPSQYETRLPGAVVKIILSFRSFKFGVHALTADIEEIRILAAPVPRHVSPKKRRFQQLITGSSPSKKSKIA